MIWDHGKENMDLQLLQSIYLYALKRSDVNLPAKAQ